MIKLERFRPAVSSPRLRIGPTARMVADPLGGFVRWGDAVELLRAVEALEARGWFAETSCADAETAQDMKAVRDALARLRHNPMSALEKTG